MNTPNQKTSSLNYKHGFYLLSSVFVIALFSYAFKEAVYPTTSISLDRMNVIYLGVDNPATVAIAGIRSEETTVTSEDLIVTDKGNGQYILNGKRPGQAKVKIAGKGHDPQVRYFRVKRIPDPVAMIRNRMGGNIVAERFKAAEGLMAPLQNFDFDAYCKIYEYRMTRVGKHEDPVESFNEGARFNSVSKKLIEKAKTGDIYYFDGVKCKCPGDAAARNINSLVFKIQ